MRGEKFCCEASRGLYEDYYTRQSGNGMPIYYGARNQRGHGLGSFLSGLFRRAMPFLTRGAKSLGKQALRTGLNIANDVVEGSSFRDAAIRHVPEGLNRWKDSGFGQSGSGKRRRSISNKRHCLQSKKKRKVSKRRHSKKKKHNDVFS